VRRIDLNNATVAHIDTVRGTNRQIILNYVREREPISRAALAHETALQRSTISRIVDGLVAEGLIEEQEGKSSGGRPPTLLRLRAAAAATIGVDLATTRTVIATSNLAGRVLQREEFVTSPRADKTLKMIVASVRRLTRKTNQRIEGIGISIPGIVESATGTALYVPFFKWQDWPIGQEVSAAVGVPVVADNDANAAALAELWFGRPAIRGIRDFILVLVEEGLGAGMVFDGEVYHGQNGAAGECGHMNIGTRAPIECAAGSRECWEAFASERSALARYARLANGKNGGARMTFSSLMDRARAGSEPERTALIETAEFLGVGISNLIKCISPKAVIVAGNITRAWSVISKPLEAVIRENSISPNLDSCRIIPSTLGDQTRLMGTFSLILANKFTSVTPEQPAKETVINARKAVSVS
jgi:predicted NBD/HSP70 family sugar kinase